MKKLSFVAILLSLLLLLTQCQKPFSVLGEKKMRAITKDLILTEAYLQQNYQPDSSAQAYYEGVFKKHGVTRAEYDSSFVWYSANAHKLSDIYTQINTELEASKALVDTFLTDSTHRYRVRFEPIESLWSTEKRLFIPKSEQLYVYTQTLYDSEELQPSDTLVWSAVGVGALPDTLKLQVQLLIVNQDGYRFDKIKGTPVSPKGLCLESKLQLPDSLPPNPRFTLFLRLQKSKQPLYLQQLSLAKKKEEEQGSEEAPPADEELETSE
ncbi:DUF4296 domain-containing protein [uncultured Porphyromonas sp.]|uniref:DUF4296 domain-containing protein n=1 Tax=uncultured Porphyromonas sp. TaxID=159274 RepID=UPI00262B8C5E|nr:DUF4296 domain-containing protein [uncultured Porphyromonas sp.]